MERTSLQEKKERKLKDHDLREEKTFGVLHVWLQEMIIGVYKLWKNKEELWSIYYTPLPLTAPTTRRKIQNSLKR